VERHHTSPQQRSAPSFDWGSKTFVMGIVNLTPDSFSGDGIGFDADRAACQAVAMQEAGADIIDVGGQSTRPGHVPITEREELDRVLPGLEAIAAQVDIPISIDTYRAKVAEAALDRGASIINDVRGLTADPDLAALAAKRDVPVVIMHDIKIEDRSRMMSQVVRELGQRVELALTAGIAWKRIIIDPGFGFGKTAEMNLELMRRLGELRVLGLPILSGTSRKSTIGKVLGTPEDDRVDGTAATVAIAIANGADVVRVHDVPQIVRVARMTDAIVRGTWSERTSG
jgi:dihydropteroate synthase